MVAHAPRRFDGGRYHFVVAALFVVILGIAGGASRADELQQIVVAIAALVAIGAALWPLDFAPLRDARGVLAAIALVYTLVLLQLVPVPPGLWAALPGHQPYATVTRAVGSSAWRPLTLAPDLTLNALAGLLPATAAALLGLMLDFRGRVRLGYWLVGIACASALLALVQLAGGGTALHLFRTTSADSAVGLFANRNHQAALMALSLPLVAALATIRLREGARPSRVLAATAASGALFLIAIAATGSRMGLLLGAVGLVAAASIWLLCAERGALALPRRRGLMVAVFAAALAAIVPIALLIARSGAVERLSSRDAIEQTRLAALTPMLEAARAFLPFGAGFGTFEPVYQRFEPNALLSTIYLNQAHNEPVQLAIEGGIAALALLALFLLWWTRAAIRAVRRRDSAARRAMGIAAASATLILMLSSLVDYPLRTPLLGGLFALFCVELVRSAHKRPRAPRRAGVRNSLAGRMLRLVAGRRGAIVAPLATGWQRERAIIAETRGRTQLLLTDPAALHILACVRAARALPGAMAEAGVFKGGSARLICENKGEAPLHLFDIFEGLQAGEHARGGAAGDVRRHFGQVHGELAEVERLLAPYPQLHFHPGLFPASANGLCDLRFSFVHLDLDLVEPTVAALDYFHPRLVPGGILIGDDYGDPPLRAAFERWFEARAETLIELPWSQVMVVRQGPAG